MLNNIRWLVTPCMHRLSPLMGEWGDVHMAPFGKSLGSSYQVSAELWPMHTFPTPDFYLYCWAKLKDNRNITAFVNSVASSRGLSELEMFLRTPSGLNVYHTWMVLLLTKAETRNRRGGRARPSKICGIFLLWRKTLSGAFNENLIMFSPCWSALGSVYIKEWRSVFRLKEVTRHRWPGMVPFRRTLP